MWTLSNHGNKMIHSKVRNSGSSEVEHPIHKLMGGETPLEVWGSGGPISIPIKLRDNTEFVKPLYVHSLESRELQQAKSEINLFYQEGKWDDYKKVTNPFEYIFLSWNRRSSRSVAVRQPLSRSYFKMIEMWKRLDLTTELAPLVKSQIGLRTAHSAEGPGGFIEGCIQAAFSAMFKGDPGWKYFGSNAITLRSDAKNVPGWRKAAKFMTINPLVWISDGEDGTGNILVKANQDNFVYNTRLRHGQGVHIYTADGGFDFSSDYNAQEDSIFPLLLAESLIGLRVLAKGGCMIIKCFDTTEQPTLDLLWLLSRCFFTWGLMKPHTSRAGNAERYFIGKGYLESISDIIQVLETYQARKNFTHPILAHPVECPTWAPTMDRIQTLQVEIEKMEILVIRQTLNLIKHTDPAVIRTLVMDNVTRSIVWCRAHDEEITDAWVTELDKNVNRETADLLNILNPPNNSVPHSYTNWNQKSTMTNLLSFNSFRTGEVAEVQTLDVNPFMRLKSKSSSLTANTIFGSSVTKVKHPYPTDYEEVPE